MRRLQRKRRQILCFLRNLQSIDQRHAQACLHHGKCRRVILRCIFRVVPNPCFFQQTGIIRFLPRINLNIRLRFQKRQWHTLFPRRRMPLWHANHQFIPLYREPTARPFSLADDAEIQLPPLKHFAQLTAPPLHDFHADAGVGFRKSGNPTAKSGIILEIRRSNRNFTHFQTLYLSAALSASFLAPQKLPKNRQHFPARLCRRDPVSAPQ